MNCEKFMSLLPSYPDAIADDREASAFRQHAAECPSCAGRLAEHEAMLATLGQMDDGLAMPESFGEGWRAAIRAESAPKRRYGSHRWQALGIAAAAVVVVGVAVLLGQGPLIFPSTLDSQQSYTLKAQEFYNDGSDRYPSPTAAPQVEALAGAAMPQAARSSLGVAHMDREAAMEEVVLEGAFMEDAFMEEAVMQEAETAADGGSGQQEQILLFSASLSLQTVDYDADMRRIDDLMETLGGWAEYRSVSGEPVGKDENAGRYAYMTLRVPMDALELFLEAVSEIGKVTHSEMVAEDVSDRYYDTQGRLAMYEAQRARLTELLGQAATTWDIVEIETRLNELQYTIETLVGRLNNWNARANNAVVRIYVMEVAEIKGENGSFGQRAASAFSGAFRSAWVFLGDAAIALVSVLPYLLCAALAAGIVLHVLLRRKKYRNKGEER